MHQGFKIVGQAQLQDQPETVGTKATNTVVNKQKPAEKPKDGMFQALMNKG